MKLLVLERLPYAPTKGGGRVRKAQERQRHQLGGEQLVVGEEVQQASAFVLPLETMDAGKVRLAGALRFEAQLGRPSRRLGREQRGPGALIGNDRRRLELVVQHRREQDLFGK